MKKGLILFARDPIPGHVKTRLAASIGDTPAAELYQTMLQDVLKTISLLDGVETIVYWDCTEESLPGLAEKYRCKSRRQGTGNLGLRIHSAFEEIFSDGSDVCCIIGSDAPDLPASYIQEAYRLLEMEQKDVVFGPTSDGGYYLLGIKQLYPRLFENISWSTASVLEQSLTAARGSGLTTALLPEWQDIDTIDDLQKYQQRNKGKS